MVSYSVCFAWSLLNVCSHHLKTTGGCCSTNWGDVFVLNDPWLLIVNVEPWTEECASVRPFHWLSQRDASLVQPMREWPNEGCVLFDTKYLDWNGFSDPGRTNTGGGFQLRASGTNSVWHSWVPDRHLVVCVWVCYCLPGVMLFSQSQFAVTPILCSFAQSQSDPRRVYGLEDRSIFLCILGCICKIRTPNRPPGLDVYTLGTLCKGCLD